MQDTILIYNLRNVGHFTTYAHNVTSWAISRGLRTVCCAPDFETSTLFKSYGTHPDVIFRDAAPLQPEALEENDALRVRNRFAMPNVLDQTDIVKRLQEEHSPRLTFLVNLDDFIFHLPIDDCLEGLFAGPTTGILTFANRDLHLCRQELYTERLKLIQKGYPPFARLFDLDEYHVLRTDPNQERVSFLPDLYCVHFPGPGAIGGDVSGLTAFLDSSHGSGAPVLPILGKFDDRKNNIWILRAACDHPGLRVAVLGERVPSEVNDAEIDALFERLDRQGRLFIENSFVPESALRLILDHPAVPCLPLPYLLHSGSSGLQIMAAHHGKPCLVPNFGLMGCRATDAGIGPVFSHGVEASFRRELNKLLQPGVSRSYAPALKKFTASFTPQAAFAALDRGLDPAVSAPALPFWTKNPAAPVSPGRAALEAFANGELAEALDLIRLARAEEPANHVLAFPEYIFLARSGRMTEAGKIRRELGSAAYLSDECFEALNRTILQNNAHYMETLQGDELFAYFEHFKFPHFRLGYVLWDDAHLCVRAGKFELAAKGYARAFEEDPNIPEILINLSDVLRYLARLDESHAALDILEARDPQFPGLACKRGQLLVEAGRLEEAAELFRLEIARGPSEFAGMAEGHLARVTERLK